jgi:hypothetical protein
MKQTPRFKGFAVLATCLAILGATVASAQVVNASDPHHNRLDLKAAQRDVAKLRADRRRARKYKNWAKAEQDERLIKADELWIMKYKHRLKHGE